MNVRLLAIILPVTLLLSGCLGQMKLDEITLLLTYGIDLAKDGSLDIYTAAPVFSREAKQKTEIMHVHAKSLREGRDHLEDEAIGTVATGKVQNIIFTKKLLQQKSIFELLDVVFRDPKSSLKADLVMVDSPIRQVMEIKIADKPRLSVYLRELVESAHTSESSVLTSVRTLYHQYYEKGITPFLTETKLVENRLNIAGTSLLNKKGFYVDTLNPKESSYLLIMQRDIQHPVSLNIELPKHVFKKKGQFGNSVSFLIDYTRFTYRTAHRDGRFQFDLHFNFRIVLNEVLVNANPLKEQKQLEQALADQIRKEMSALVAKLQKQQLDPIGLGLYARAFAYNEWKQVQNDWGLAFSQAKVNINPAVSIISIGSLKNAGIKANSQ
ncbi:Ger(x)C family spore germination protein [Brevibacillus fluminis]|uniref:Ger(x)C family spore germination protein n=1 Tax=Brevibacillus fluminis TaxID=511487 RepID=UPI003F8A089D